MEKIRQADAYKVILTVFVGCPYCKKDVQFSCDSDSLTASQWGSEFVRIGSKSVNCPKCDNSFETLLFDLDISEGE